MDNGKKLCETYQKSLDIIDQDLIAMQCRNGNFQISFLTNEKVLIPTNVAMINQIKRIKCKYVKFLSFGLNSLYNFFYV